MASHHTWRLWAGSKRRKVSVNTETFAFPVDDEDEECLRRDPVKLGQLYAREAFASEVVNKARGDPSPLELEAACPWQLPLEQTVLQPIFNGTDGGNADENSGKGLDVATSRLFGAHWLLESVDQGMRSHRSDRVGLRCWP